MPKYKKTPAASSTIPGVSSQAAAPGVQQHQQQQMQQSQPRMAGNMMATTAPGMGPPGRMPQLQGKTLRSVFNQLISMWWFFLRGSNLFI